MKRFISFLTTPVGIVALCLALALVTSTAIVYTINRDGESGFFGQDSSEINDTASGGGSGGSPLTGSTSGLIGSVVSTRNLQGILVQINQIDVCEAPELSAYISITDKDGRVFRDVRSGDFSIKLDGQEIDDFTFRTVNPAENGLNTVMALDRSGSMEGDPMVKLKQAASTYIDQARTHDRIGLIGFDRDVEVISGLSSNKRSLKQAINAMESRGFTSLFDASIRATEIAPECGRKAAIVMTDGDDNTSESSLANAIDAANQTSTPLFVVGLRSSDYQPQILQKMARDTGALYFDARSPDELIDMYRTIDSQLAQQYQFKLELPISRQNRERRLEIIFNGDSDATSARSFVY